MVSVPHFLVVFLHQVGKLLASGSPAENPLKKRITLDVRITLLSDEVREPPSHKVASLARCCWGKLACLGVLNGLVEDDILHVHIVFLTPAALNSAYRVGMDGHTLWAGRLTAPLIVPP